MAKKSYKLKTDITQQYLIPLTIVGDDYLTVEVVCDVCADKDVIIATAAESKELFQTHRYNDEFFQWLLYTGEIKLYTKDSRNNNEP